MTNPTSSDRLTILAFIAVVIFLGVNFVAVRFSNQELPPFWGAALRFLIASAILFSFVYFKKITLPSGRSLHGAVIYGVLSFGLTYALLYWALLYVSSSLTSVVFATLPLATLIIAWIIRLEHFSWRGLAGAVLVILGIGFVFAQRLHTDVTLMPLLAVLLAVVSAAISTIVIKLFPQPSPLSANAVGMGVGAIFLLHVSFFAKESYVLPEQTSTWMALAWLVASSIVAFVLLVWIISRWTASAASYVMVLSPLVTVIVATWLAQESVSVQFILGALVVLTGVYLGAIYRQQSS